tara:strand:- start:1859 stop:2371 length:513 start_codon:yes stop_codon:yes gene_type:complete
MSEVQEDNNNIQPEVEIEAVESLLEKGLTASIKEQETLDNLVKSVSVMNEQLSSLSQIENLQKSIDELKDSLDTLKTSLDEKDEKIQKSLKIIEETPMQKAILTEAEIAPASEKVVADVSWGKEEVLNKGLALLDTTTDNGRKYEIRRQIAKLDSGFHPSDVASSLGLSK